MNDKNVTLARRWFQEIWNERRIATIHEFITEESICYSERGPLRGAEPFITLVYQPFLDAFPDLRVNVIGTIAEGDQVVVRWEATGTHSGGGMGLAPSGRPVQFFGMTWIRFADGKMIEGRDSWNLGGLVESLK